MRYFVGKKTAKIVAVFEGKARVFTRIRISFYFTSNRQKHTTGRTQRKDREGHQSLLRLWQLLLATWFALDTRMIVFLLFVLINDVNYYLMKIFMLSRIRCKLTF